jgi:hypothetical protein
MLVSIKLGVMTLLTGLLLSACASVVPVEKVKFPLQAAYAELISQGSVREFSLTGSCVGNGRYTRGVASVSTLFEKTPALSAEFQVMTGPLTKSYATADCVAMQHTFTSYYDTDYMPLGFDSRKVNYGVYLSSAHIPTQVSVGDTGIVGTEVLWKDASKSISNGRIETVYIVESDTTKTAVVNFIGKAYNASNKLISTEQDRYRVFVKGALVPVSADIQYGSGTRLLITYQ